MNIVALLALLAFSSQPPVITVPKGEAHLTLEFESNAPYRLAASCDLMQPIVVLNVLVRNSGGAANQPIVNGILAVDSAASLGGGVDLPAVGPYGSVAITLPMRRVGSASAAALVGTHNVTVGVGTLHSAPLAVQVPASLCAPVAGALAKTSGVTPPLVPPAAGAAAGHASNSSATLSNGGPIGGAGRPVDSITAIAPELPIPTDLHYTTNVATCVAHGGDGESCQLLARQNAVAVYWSGNSSQCASCKIAGFRVRKPPIGSPPGQPLSQTSDQIAIEFVPAEGWGGSCFVVSSYSEAKLIMVNDGAGGKVSLPGFPTEGKRAESTPSQKLCIGATRRDVSIAPSAALSFQRSHTFNTLTNVSDDVRDYPPQPGLPMSIGARYTRVSRKGTTESQVNTFTRNVVAFEPSTLGSATVYGGSLAYEGADGFCTRLSSPAPAGWEGATWPTPGGTSFALAPRGAKVSVPMDQQLRGWHPGAAPKTFMFDGLLDGLDEPHVRAGMMIGGNCEGSANNLRLVISTGIDQ